MFNRFEKTLCGMETRVDSDCIAKTFTGKLYALFYLMNRAKSTYDYKNASEIGNADTTLALRH